MQRNPVMIFAGSFWSGGTENGLADGFRALGWAVQEIDNRDFQINPGRHLGLRLAARVFGKNMVKNYQNRILENCRVLKPDVFLTVKGIGITPDLLRQIRALGVCTMMYYPDVAFNHRGVSVESFNEYDLFITTKTFQLEYLENMLGSEHVTYVPHGYSSSVHRPVFDCISEESYHIDLLYSGNHSPYKQRWLEETLAILPEEISVEIVGNRWARHGSAGVLARCGMPGAQMGVAYARAIQTARINIAIHFGPTASGWEDLVSTRTFEIPACKGFMLHIDNDEVREFFKPGEEIDVFSTPEELADKVRFYLARPELRAQMIERAYARCVPAYGYAERAKLMADSMVECNVR